MPDNIAIITARGGSKRIPRKNINPFLGKPIIQYSIGAAISSNLFSKVIVSTDDEEIAGIARRAGAEVPFLRSEENSNDYAGTADVIIEVIQKLEAMGLHFTNICCIYPAAPFITAQRLTESYELLIEKQLDSVFPVCQFSFPIFRGLQIDDDGKVKMIWPENISKRSQDLPPVYHDAGQFYWMRTEAILREKRLYMDRTGAVILSELEVQDIDNINDWKLAELKYQLLT